MLSLLRKNPEFRRLWLAHAISRSGDAFNTVAVVVLVFQLTGMGRGVAGAVMFEVLPMLLIGPIAGLAADANALDRLAAGLLGTRPAPVVNAPARFAAAAFLCAQHDEVVGTAVAKMAHLFAPPAEAFGDPLVSSRINEFLTSGVSLDRPADVPPSRAAFESLATG